MDLIIIYLPPNPKVHKKLTRLAFENLLHPFQPFSMGQMYFPIKMAIKNNIKLIIFGDAQAENSGDDDLFKGGAQINTQIYSYNKEDLFSEA